MTAPEPDPPAGTELPMTAPETNPAVPTELPPNTRAIDARWASDDTQPSKIADALRRLETTRTNEGASVAPARALTLVVLVDPEHDDGVRADKR